MNPTMAVLGLGIVFVVLAFLMLIRSGHQDASTPSQVMNRPAEPKR
jgi:Na+-transporting methylmalonyl-CoA/oxaloacetate decarboxylase gamma subunit